MLRLVELAEPHRHVAADDDRTPAVSTTTTCMPREWPGAGTSRSPESSSSSPSTGTYARRAPRPTREWCSGPAARVVELPALDVDRPAGEEVVAAAVVEVQVSVDDDVDAGEVEVLLAQWTEAGIEVGHRRVQLRHAGVDQHARVGMVDDVHVDGHPLALGEQVGHEERRDCGRRRHSPILARQRTPHPGTRTGSEMRYQRSPVGPSR